MAVRDIVQAAAGLGGTNLYVEDVFATYAYAGNGSTQTITNGIDLAGEGGLVWAKDRNNAINHYLTDTVRGLNHLSTNTTDAQVTQTDPYFVAQSDGYQITNYVQAACNGSGDFISWTFRKAPKFFDVVTYTGNNEVAQYVNHSLGVVPGCIILKSLSNSGPWFVWHRGLSSTSHALRLNTTAEESVDTNYEIGINATDTQIYIDTGSDINYSGDQYVAYLFAHDAGGFGDSGEESIIKCGSYNGNGGYQNIDVGFEPQWILSKRSSGGTSNWAIFDTMRGWTSLSDLGDAWLEANTNSGENRSNTSDYGSLTPTGFRVTPSLHNDSGSTYIYIVIRRGPMKKPTDATKVFAPVALTPSSDQLITTNFPVDLTILAQRDRTASGYTFVHTRMLGGFQSSIARLSTNTTDALYTSTSGGFSFDSNVGVRDKFYNSIQGFSTSTIYWNFRRAPGFFDVVPIRASGSSPQVVTHNLGVAPELIITKRTDAYDWVVSNPADTSEVLYLNLTNAGTNYQGIDTLTSTTFNVYGVVNATDTIAYLFASCPGVSKVGSYIGNGGTAQNINCGFSNGARFILIKEESGAGHWYIFDTARGIVSGSDPYLLVNGTTAEGTLDMIDPYSPGFTIAGTYLNGDTSRYIFLAIA